jgi:hypothetical protein
MRNQFPSTWSRPDTFDDPREETTSSGKRFFFAVYSRFTVRSTFELSHASASMLKSFRLGSMERHMRTARRNVRRAGRPPAGINGDRVADYPQLSMRVPPKVRETINAVAEVRGMPHWRILMEALSLYVLSLSYMEREEINLRLGMNATQG